MAGILPLNNSLNGCFKRLTRSLSTWPLHVRLLIVQSIIMAYVQFYLPLLHWSFKHLASYTSQAMEIFWKTKSHKKALRLLPMQSVCSPKTHGGLNILNLQFHMLARKSTMISDFFQQKQPWAIMLAAMCGNMKSHAYGDWITDN